MNPTTNSKSIAISRRPPNLRNDGNYDKYIKIYNDKLTMVNNLREFLI